MSSDYGKRKARASRRATPIISEDPSDNSQFDLHIALRNALELQRDVLGIALVIGHSTLSMAIGLSSPHGLKALITRSQDLPIRSVFPALSGSGR